MVHGVLKVWAFPLLKGLFIKKVSGLENLPKKGPYIILANHASYLDPVLLTAAIVPKINKKITFIAWHKIFKWWSGFFLKIWFGSIPEHGAVEKALNFLKKGGIIGIFPEGGRTRNGKIQKIEHTGAAVLAILARSPIVPVSIDGTFDLWPRQRRFPKLSKIAEIKIGKPIHLKYKKIPARPVMLKELNKLMKKIESMKKNS